MAFKTCDQDDRIESLHLIDYEVWAGPRSKQSRYHDFDTGLKDSERPTGPGLNLGMDRHSYESLRSSSPRGNQTTSDSRRVYIALGSNEGDRTKMIDRACQAMNHSSIKIVRTSALYETEPMYVKDQRPFINGVCEVEIFFYL